MNLESEDRIISALFGEKIEESNDDTEVDEFCDKIGQAVSIYYPSIVRSLATIIGKNPFGITTAFIYMASMATEAFIDGVIDTIPNRSTEEKLRQKDNFIGIIQNAFLLRGIDITNSIESPGNEKV